MQRSACEEDAQTENFGGRGPAQVIHFEIKGRRRRCKILHINQVASQLVLNTSWVEV